jgi:sugar/nucleoside kinase (ribokinase family)
MTFYDEIDSQRKLIVGVGSALIDILANENDAFLKKTGAVKGGMLYVEKQFIDYTVGMASLTPQVVPGGSACNTMVGIGRLGGLARFVGKCGNGPMGQLYRSDLLKQNVEPMLVDSDTPTGRVLSIITPDAQRSMFTFLGASAEARPEEIKPEKFKEAAIVHVEGYLLFNRDLIRAVFEAAQAAGARISLDLASFNVVRESKDILHDLVHQYVDILIANEDEALAYTGVPDERQSIEIMSKDADLAVLKLGPRGSMIRYDGEIITVPAQGGQTAVDTTGAGDLWASGFLYGLINRLPLSQCGVLGSICGYEVCQVIGAHIADDRWNVIQNYLEEKWPKNVLPVNNC